MLTRNDQLAAFPNVKRSKKLQKSANGVYVNILLVYEIPSHLLAQERNRNDKKNLKNFKSFNKSCETAKFQY